MRDWLLPVVGLVMIVAGIVGFVRSEWTYTTTEEVVKIGSLKAETTEEHVIEIPAWLSATVLGAGAALFVLGARGKGR